MERKPEDNKEKEEKMKYEPPELIDLAGEVAKGACSPVGSMAVLCTGGAEG
jgi:hypothetical protein